MQIVIDISEEKYKWIKENNPKTDKNSIVGVILHGTPLQEPKTGQFAEWVAREIFDDNWEYNKNAFAELACRKLSKLGIVRAKGDEWELVEPQERSDKE